MTREGASARATRGLTGSKVQRECIVAEPAILVAVDKDGLVRVGREDDIERLAEALGIRDIDELEGERVREPRTGEGTRE